jgi:hypothetical protein
LSARGDAAEGSHLREQMAGMSLAAPEDEATAGQKRRRPSLPSLADKYARRLRQRLPKVKDMPASIRARLLSSAWFVRVDAILRQNSLVEAVQLQMRQAVQHALRPAEHFYNTAVEVFAQGRGTAESFLLRLRDRMGAAWDDRLQEPALSFFHSASQAGDGDALPAAADAARTPAPAQAVPSSTEP